MYKVGGGVWRQDGGEGKAAKKLKARPGPQAQTHNLLVLLQGGPLSAHGTFEKAQGSEPRKSLRRLDTNPYPQAQVLTWGVNKLCLKFMLDLVFKRQPIW